MQTKKKRNPENQKTVCLEHTKKIFCVLITCFPLTEKYFDEPIIKVEFNEVPKSGA